ncbi:MAG: SIMPL domain-containing protein [Candidatus Nitrosocaldus sp.]
MASRISKKAMAVAGTSIVVFALLLTFVAWYDAMDVRAQGQGNEKDATERIELSVTGNAVESIKPDKASISVGVEVQEKTAGEAASKNAKLMSSVIEAIKALGIREEQISTNYYSIYPVYEPRSKGEVCITIYPPPPECQEQVLVGYKAVNSITITMDVNVQNIGSVIDAAVNAGANQVYGVSFFISQERLDAVKASLLDKAAKDARVKADTVANALNMKVVGVKSIYVIDGYYPMPYPMPAYASVREAQVTTPIIPSEQSVSASVQVVFWLQ